MALLEKMSGAVDDNGVNCKIPPFHFYCTLREIIAGEINQNQAATFWDGRMGGQWDTSDTTDLAWLISEHDNTSTNKEIWLAGLFAIIGAVELDAPGYVTNADIKSRIQRL